jgi:hypothetical protein
MKTQHPYQFGRAAGDQAQATAQNQVVDRILWFVSEGLRDPYTRQTSSALDSFRMLIQNHMLQQVAGTGVVPTARSMSETWKNGAWDVAKDLAYRAFLQRYQEATVFHFGKLPVPAGVSCLDSAEEERVAQELGATRSERPSHAHPIEQAYAIAEFNVQRCEQRITLLYALAELVRRSGDSRLPTDAAEKEFQAASREFWTQRALQLSRMLALGTLLGGEYLERNKHLVKKMYGDGKSVMELLTVDNMLPDRWRTTDEQLLRDSIATA